MRRTPKRFRVSGHMVEVRVVDHLTHDNGHDDPDMRFSAAYGIYDPSEMAVYLTREMSVERQKNTLVHEALHAMLDIPHTNDNIETEEELVGKLATTLLDFIRQNKALVSYLQET